MTAPIDSFPFAIDGFPVVHAHVLTYAGRRCQIWAYYATEEVAAQEGLRIEYSLRHDGQVELRLVKGPVKAPKHLEIIRLRVVNESTVKTAAAKLKKSYNQKGW